MCPSTITQAVEVPRDYTPEIHSPPERLHLSYHRIHVIPTSFPRTPREPHFSDVCARPPIPSHEVKVGFLRVGRLASAIYNNVLFRE